MSGPYWNEILVYMARIQTYWPSLLLQPTLRQTLKQRIGQPQTPTSHTSPDAETSTLHCHLNAIEKIPCKSLTQKESFIPPCQTLTLTRGELQRVTEVKKIGEKGTTYPVLNTFAVHLCNTFL